MRTSCCVDNRIYLNIFTVGSYSLLCAFHSRIIQMRLWLFKASKMMCRFRPLRRRIFFLDYLSDRFSYQMELFWFQLVLITIIIHAQQGPYLTSWLPGGRFSEKLISIPGRNKNTRRRCWCNFFLKTLVGQDWIFLAVTSRPVNLDEPFPPSSEPASPFNELGPYFHFNELLSAQ